jgi:IPT/TIG domain
MRKLLASAVALSVCLPAVLAPAAIAAPTITVGSSLITEPTMKESFSGNSVTVANASVADPDALAASPVDGTVVRWRLGPQQTSGTTYRLDILRPFGAGAYVLAGASDPHSAATAWTEVFPTSLPIKAGDLIGLKVEAPVASVTLAVVPVAGPAQYFWDPALTDSGPTAAPGTGKFEVNFNADVRAAPQVTLLSPASGPIGGGTVVTIAGANFSAISGVTFGSAPAPSFSVDSEGAITATAPPAVDGAGPVDVTVTSAVGTSAIGAQDRFTYQAPASPSPPPPPAAPSGAAPQPPAPSCVVPRLIGRQLAASRRLIGQRHCLLGTVLDRKKGPRKVVRQSPKPGTVRAGSSRVNITLG